MKKREKPKNINNVSVGGPALQRARAFDWIINYYGPVIVSASRTKKSNAAISCIFKDKVIVFFSLIGVEWQCHWQGGDA